MFRADELRSLLRANFCLDSELPTVTVEAAYAKSGEKVDQPIRRDLADILRPWLATRPSDGPVLPLPDRTADMLKVDLKAAGAPYVDASGRIADFHALRVTYITAIVKGGATVKQAQSLSRHSDPKLTLNVYAKLGINDLASALDALPAVEKSCSNVAAMKAAGTDDTGMAGARNRLRNGLQDDHLEGLAAALATIPQSEQASVVAHVAALANLSPEKRAALMTLAT